MNKNTTYKPLVKSYRGIFPFVIGTTSYIYPDNIIPNVEMLAPYLDEIELLFLENSQAGIPDKQEIKELAIIAADSSISYNIHLPMDIYIGSESLSDREYALDTIKRIIDLTSPLPCSTHTLHIEYPDNSDLKKWKYHSFKSMEKLASSDIKPESISIETLMYPFEWVEKIITDFYFSICMDTGHLMLQKIDPYAFFNKHLNRISIIHLHGVEKEKDHISLSRLGKNDMETVLKILKKFTGVVSIEVFAYNNLETSLNFLESSWQNKLLINQKEECLL